MDEITVEAYQYQVVALGDQVLVGVVEVESEFLHQPDHRFQFLRKHGKKAYVSFDKEILNKVDG